MNKQRTLLLVEDDEKIMAINRRALKPAGHQLLEAEDLATARVLLSQCIPDVIILDIILPDGNGLDFIPEIREKTNAPILLLTALGKINEKIEGLRAGGDDYIAKPYDINEFRERVAAAIRRGDMTPKKIMRGSLTLDVTAQQAFMDEDDLLLTKKEFALLLIFVQNEEKILTKKYLYESVWNQPIADDGNALSRHISTLRTKIEKYDRIALKVIRNEGYSFEFTQ